MTAPPFPNIEAWEISADVLCETLAAVQPAGDDGREAGVLWMGPRDTRSEVRAVVIPRGPGVEEEVGHWRVAPEVFASVARWSRPRGMSLLAICHIHGRGIPARLSSVDRTQLVRAPGVLAIVIGEGGREADPRRWGWYVFEHGDYREMFDADHACVQFTEAPIEVWVADQNNCRPAS